MFFNQKMSDRNVLSNEEGKTRWCWICIIHPVGRRHVSIGILRTAIGKYTDITQMSCVIARVAGLIPSSMTLKNIRIVVSTIPTPAIGPRAR